MTTLPVATAAHTAVTVAAPFAVTRRHEQALAASLADDIGPASPLIDRGALEAIRAELAPAVADGRATPEEIGPHVARLNAAFPQRDARADDELRAYFEGMAEALTAFPPDIVRAGCATLRRTATFRPTVAEVVQACEAILARRRSLLIAVQRQEREHQRRAAEDARRQREEEARAEWERRLDARLAERFGEQAPPAGCWREAHAAIAWTLSPKDRDAWTRAVLALEPWAAVAYRRAVLIGRVRALAGAQPPRIARNVAGALRLLEAGDEAAAAALIDAAETDPGIPPAGETAPVDWLAFRSAVARALDRAPCETAAIPAAMLTSGTEVQPTW